MPGNRLADRLFGRPPVTSVDEKDVELVLLDLIHTCGDFLKFLVNHVTKEIADHRFRGAWRQVSGSAVITDLEILIESLMGETNAFLIECKVTHSEQPEQAERYKKKGRRGARRPLLGSVLDLSLSPCRLPHPVTSCQVGFCHKHSGSPFLDGRKSPRSVTRARKYAESCYRQISRRWSPC